MRDVQKFVKYIQKLNGVDKLDLHPPTGFDTCPDVLLVGGNAGHDGYSLFLFPPSPPHDREKACGHVWWESRVPGSRQ